MQNVDGLINVMELHMDHYTLALVIFQILIKKIRKYIIFKNKIYNICTIIY